MAKLRFEAKLSCLLDEEPVPWRRWAYGRTTNRRFERAGGKAGCHAVISERMFRADARRVKSHGAMGRGWAHRSGLIRLHLPWKRCVMKPRLRAGGFSQLKLWEKTKGAFASIAYRLGSEVFNVDRCLMLPS